MNEYTLVVPVCRTHDSRLILSDIIRGAVCNILRVPLSKLGFPLPLAVQIEDTCQTYYGRIIQVGPHEVFFSDWNLSTTGGDNAPTELLLYWRGLQPARILAQSSHYQLEYRVHRRTGDRPFLWSRQIWDHLLNYHQNQLLELISLAWNRILVEGEVDFVTQ